LPFFAPKQSTSYIMIRNAHKEWGSRCTGKENNCESNNEKKD
jgi:hypothetical protein